MRIHSRGEPTSILTPKPTSVEVVNSFLGAAVGRYSEKQEIVVCKRSIAFDFLLKCLLLLSGGSFGATSAVYEALSGGRMCEC